MFYDKINPFLKLSKIYYSRNQTRMDETDIIRIISN